MAYLQGDNSEEGVSTGRLSTVGSPVTNYALRNRTVAKSGGEDHSKVFQADFIGHELKTGILKHTFQLGFDWKESYTTTNTYSGGYTEPSPIDVTGTVSNILPSNIDIHSWTKTGSSSSPKSPIYGLMAQEMRYSSYQGNNQKGKKFAWDPSFGIMISPFLENVNLYASYTTTTGLRGNDNPLQGGGTVGASVTRQWEAGIKSDWFEEKLRFNVNFYSMDMNNLSYRVLDLHGNNTPFYDFAGDLTRKGVEIDLIGKILPELEVMAGYSYLDAKYHDSPAYVNGSRPMMAAKNTANGWLNYTFRSGVLKGLSFGGGVYYVGERPVNEYTQKTIIHNTIPGVKPFMLNAYTTINAQIGYTYKNASIRVFANNLTDAIGYNAYYRGGFLNRNDPRNFAVQVNYKF